MKNLGAIYQSLAPVSPLKNELLEKLAYFGVFNHPLNATEIQNHLHNHYSIERIQHELDELVGMQLCYSFNGFYSMHSGVVKHLSSRLEKERTARSFFRKLPFYVRIISSFPFVRGVAVSGSLSKGLIHNGGDIDYFIITAHNRLWVTRMMLVLFKKLFLFNSRKYFCVNYFVSEKHLEIPDQNLFTATEIVTLLPVYNLSEIQRFKAENSWVNLFYGHFEHPIAMPVQEVRFGLVKKLGERVLSAQLGEWLDNLSMRLTIWRWHVKFGSFSQRKFDLALRSNRNVSKHHPRDFQTVVLDALRKNLDSMTTCLERQK